MFVSINYFIYTEDKNNFYLRLYRIEQIFVLYLF